MSKFITEFKEFINKGNAMDMAVGVIIGGAFTAIVTSLTTDILGPVLNLLTTAAGGGADATPALLIPVPGSEDPINISAFISAIVNFLIMAFVVFLLVKGINSLANAGKKIIGKDGEPEPEPEAPTCPYCLEEIKEGATRCPHCAGNIDAYVAPEEA